MFIKDLLDPDVCMEIRSSPIILWQFLLRPRVNVLTDESLFVLAIAPVPDPNLATW